MDDIFLWLAIGILFILILYIAYEVDGLKEENEYLRFKLDILTEELEEERK